MATYEEWEEAMKEDKDDWRTRHESMKKRVGMAPHGTTQYWRNAAKVLSVHSGPGMKPETRAKLECLAQSSDPETKATALAALKKT
jgi:hypothetical protein